MIPKHNYNLILLFYIISFLIFIATATIITAYSLGYRYNFTNHKIIKTGILRLSPIQQDYSINIDDTIVKPETIKHTTEIPNLTPKSYTITISQEHYQSWTKDIEITPNKIQNENNILLIPVTPKTIEIDYAQKYVSNKNQLIAYLSNNSLSILNFSNGKIDLFESINISQTSEIYWSSPELLSIITTSPESKTSITVINSSNNNTSQKQIDLPIKSENILCHLPIQSNILLFLYQNTIFKTDLFNSNPSQKYLDNIELAKQNNNSLYFTNTNEKNILKITNLNFNTTQKIYFENDIQDLLFVDQLPYIILVSDNNQNIIFDTNSEKIIDSYEGKTLKTITSPESNQILINTTYELKIMNTQNTPPDTNTILRLSTAIEDSSWIDNNNIIFVTKSEINRIDNSGQNTQTIESNDNNKYEIVFSNREKILTIVKHENKILLKYIFLKE